MAYNFIICNNMEEAESYESAYGNEYYEISGDDIKALEDGKILTGMINDEYALFIKRKETDKKTYSGRYIKNGGATMTMASEKLAQILAAHKKGGSTANLSGADLSGANLSGADLCGADLSGADLRWADLRWANLSGADLSTANLRWANLSGADLSTANLNGADFSRANLSQANLSEADLSRADLNGANLNGANLSEADLRWAHLSGVDLSTANLRMANLSGADLSGATGLLSTVDFLEAHFERADAGYIAYKTFNATYAAPAAWEIKKGAVISENVNFDRCTECGCGVNVAPLEWVKREYGDLSIWKVLIRWEWLCGVCAPYMSDGKIRCERVELLEVVT